MLELATLGAQVLHNRSVELAKKYNVKLEVLSSFTGHPGTKVKGVAKRMEKTAVSSVAKDGYVSSTGMEFVDALLTRGGLDSMLSTVSLMICALTTGGILEKTGMLEALHVLKHLTSM